MTLLFENQLNCCELIIIIIIIIIYFYFIIANLFLYAVADIVLALVSVHSYQC